MSFSSDVKVELARQTAKSRHCQLAELAGMFLMEGQVQKYPLELRMQMENEHLHNKFQRLLSLIFGEDFKQEEKQIQARKILEALKLWNHTENEPNQDEIETCRCNGLLLQRTCCKRAFLRGAFMGSGSISDPSKSYHFEIVCRTKAQAQQLQELIAGFDMDAKIVERKQHPVLYLKEGAQIVDMLNVMEAYVALMNLENVRILKEMRNFVNRKVNCETANISKTVNAAVRQIEDIRLIADRMGLEKLPQNLRETAMIRLEYPEAPLKELGNYMDPPVGKSGVNHRFQKLSEIAERLRQG